MKTPLERLFALRLVWWVMLAVAFLPLHTTQAQPVVRWAKTDGTSGQDFCSDMALSPSGVLHLVGSLDAANSSKPEVVLLRFDSNGVSLGSQASRGEQIRGVAVDADGNYYLTGRVWDPTRLGQGKLNDLYLGKFSSTGALLWERTLGSSGTASRRESEGGYDVALDEDGNIYVAGSSSNAATFDDVTFPNTPGGPLLCKFDPNGRLLWAKRVEGRYQIFQGTILGCGIARSLALDRQGNIVLTGYLYNGSTDFGGKVVKVAGPNDSDFFIAKFSGAGEVQWVQIGYGYGGLAVDRESNIFFNGYVAGDYAMRCGAFTPTGTILWERTIPGAFGAGVALTPMGEPVFAAEFEGTVDLDGHVVAAVPDTNQKFLICSASAGGQFRWAIGDAGLALSRAGRVVTSDDGRIFVAGDVRCIWQGGWICEPGQIDSFSLPPPGDATFDLILARVDVPVPQPVNLSVRRNNSTITLAWPASATGYALERTDSISSANWNPVPDAPATVGDQLVITLELSSGAQFFRLRQR